MLCKQNPNKRCTGNFAHKYWVGDKLLAKCEGEIQVRRNAAHLRAWRAWASSGPASPQRSRQPVSCAACTSAKHQPGSLRAAPGG